MDQWPRADAGFSTSPAVGPPKVAASGPDALLATKLHVPRPQPGFVPRPRLARQLAGKLAGGGFA